MYNNFAEALWPSMAPARALEMMRFGVDFAERRGLRRIATHTASSTLNPLYELGEWDEATVACGAPLGAGGRDGCRLVVGARHAGSPIRPARSP